MRKHSKEFGYHTFSRIGAGIGLHVSTRSPEMIGLRVIAAADKPGQFRLIGRLTVRFCCLCPLVFSRRFGEGRKWAFLLGMRTTNLRGSIMQLLQNKVKEEGIVLSGQVLKVDSFLNHQMDPVLMKEVGKEFTRLFKEANVTRVLTIESSGIAPGIMTALEMEVPLIFARKQKSLTLREDIFVEKVYSFTKQETNEITVAKKFIKPGDKVLIVDDFLANGEAAFGLARIVEQAGAEVVGIGIVIEKAFQPGGRLLAEAGYRVESLVRIASLEDGVVTFA